MNTCGNKPIKIHYNYMVLAVWLAVIIVVYIRVLQSFPFHPEIQVHWFGPVQFPPL